MKRQKNIHQAVSAAAGFDLGMSHRHKPKYSDTAISFFHGIQIRIVSSYQRSAVH
jgi:hypothetical protein